MNRDIVEVFTIYANRIVSAIQFDIEDDFFREQIELANLGVQNFYSDISYMDREQKDDLLKDEFTKTIYKIMTDYRHDISENLRQRYSDQECRIKVKDSTDKMLKKIKKLIPWENMTKEVVEKLKFSYYDEKNLYLVPVYLVDALPEGTKILPYNSEQEITVGTDKLDKEERGGFLLYGIKAKMA